VTKHSPSAFEEAQRIAGVEDPSLCIFADDSVRNIETAKALGWSTILVGTHSRDTEELIVCPEADHIIATIHQLPEVMPDIFMPTI
jgi:FMN phosphatase YigB (HAD superfamily)